MSEKKIDVGFPPPGVEITVSLARAHLPELIERVRDGETIYLTRYGKRVVALVPADMAEDWDRIEDEYWGKKAEEAMADPEPSVPLAQVIAESEALD